MMILLRLLFKIQHSGNFLIVNMIKDLMKLRNIYKFL